MKHNYSLMSIGRSTPNYYIADERIKVTLCNLPKKKSNFVLYFILARGYADNLFRSLNLKLEMFLSSKAH